MNNSDSNSPIHNETPTLQKSSDKTPPKVRVVWFKNVPSTPKYYNVPDIDTGLEWLLAFSAADLQDESVISNVGALQVYYPDWNGDFEDEDGWHDLETSRGYRYDFVEQCQEVGLTFTEAKLNRYFAVEQF